LKQKSRFAFKIESLFFRIRECFSPPGAKLIEAAIQPGWQVLDFGCGIGSYSVAAARIVGEAGKVYAVDCQSLAIERVKARATRKGLSNVQTILTDSDTRLENGTINAVFMYDVFHDLEQPGQVIDELARILKREGFISFSDHHMKRTQIISSMTEENKFRLANEGRLTYTFKLSG